MTTTKSSGNSSGMTDQELRAELRKICRAHEKIVQLMKRVQDETDIDFGVYVPDEANEIVVVRGLNTIAEALKAKITQSGAQRSVICGATQIVSFFDD